MGVSFYMNDLCVRYINLDLERAASNLEGASHHIQRNIRPRKP